MKILKIILLMVSLLSSNIFAMQLSEQVFSEDTQDIVVESQKLQINAKNKKGYNALMLAAYYNQTSEVMEILLNTNIDINAKNNDGWTALMLAVSQRHVEAVKSLLKHKANVDIVGKDGLTALDIAINKKYPEIVRLFKQ